MAGKRQHHIWQLIQRGFGEKRGKDYHIWVYEKGPSPKRTSTRKYGMEPFFFSDGNDNTADNTITNFENSVQSRIRALRTANDGTEVGSDFMAPFVAHLEMRSLFLRAEMSSVGQKVLTRLLNILKDEKSAAKLMLSYLQAHPELVDKKLDEYGIQKKMVPIAKAFIDLKAPSPVKQQAAPLAKMAQLLLVPLIQEMPRISKDAHLKSLNEDFSEIERTEIHLGMNYRICKSTDSILSLMCS